MLPEVKTFAEHCKQRLTANPELALKDLFQDLIKYSHLCSNPPTKEEEQGVLAQIEGIKTWYIRSTSPEHFFDNILLLINLYTYYKDLADEKMGAKIMRH